MVYAIGAGQAMVRLQGLMVLVLSMVLVWGMLLVFKQQIGHPTSSTIQPGIVALLVVLGVHAGTVRQSSASQGFDVASFSWSPSRSMQVFSLKYGINR